jgi:hypothetical protein
MNRQRNRNSNSRLARLIRFVSALVFLLGFISFLAWYDGWGRGPLTAEEVDGYLANIPEQSEFYEVAERLRRMGADDDGDEFYMLNLNRYEYAEGESEDEVPAAYREYSAAVIGMVLENAGHPVYVGRFPDYRVVGATADAGWDEVILVRYRSRRDFITMVTSDEYQAIARVRAGGVEYAEVGPTMSGLSATTPRLVVALLLLMLAWIADILIRKFSGPAALKE